MFVVKMLAALEFATAADVSFEPAKAAACFEGIPFRPLRPKHVVFPAVYRALQS